MSLSISRQKAFLLLTLTYKLQVSRQKVFLLITRQPPTAYAPAMQFGPTALRWALQTPPDDLPMARRIGQQPASRSATLFTFVTA